MDTLIFIKHFTSVEYFRILGCLISSDLLGQWLKTHLYTDPVTNSNFPFQNVYTHLESSSNFLVQQLTVISKHVLKKKNLNLIRCSLGIPVFVFLLLLARMYIKIIPICFVCV